MNKYIYSICPSDQWPIIKSVLATSIKDAEEKVLTLYSEKYLESNTDSYEDFQESLNEIYNVILSDLYDIDELL